MLSLLWQRARRCESLVEMRIFAPGSGRTEQDYVRIGVWCWCICFVTRTIRILKLSMRVVNEQTSSINDMTILCVRLAPSLTPSESPHTNPTPPTPQKIAMASWRYSDLNPNPLLCKAKSFILTPLFRHRYSGFTTSDIQVKIICCHVGIPRTLDSLRYSFILIQKLSHGK